MKEVDPATKPVKIVQQQGPFRVGKTRGNRMKKKGESYLEYRGKKES